jgi:hypothetical protein
MTIIVRFVLKVLGYVAKSIFRRSAANGGPVDMQLGLASNVSDTSFHCPSLPYGKTLPPCLSRATELGSSTVSRLCYLSALHMVGETDRKTLSLFIFHGMTATANDSLQGAYQSCFYSCKTSRILFPALNYNF